ncbi:hypothetical protein BD780_000879 [Clostridium tetanomorphum]|uniref:Uncharacterized protein n=1 Tax=Clostridium tetanomorphum TaxID=1553 RepID=A0A923J0Z6_CLOTT|nr:hypothetical protein [Clostridium tetanomorphum]KAJ53099.1 hypothetical protein CTM_04175 [Clostridium tetanomorphum DSM 665]MBC2398786.1 hypothetical protein [Clostridium tetanomorphum]MBP1863555.1 hypothetical protein [Clostridium tetanomorphum]NRS83654.1 hypothetical protein [Clostridium tetanomorphum]NRZ96848.1 hypothetical protein [Clostridium tetanomorphum]
MSDNAGIKIFGVIVVLIIIVLADFPHLLNASYPKKAMIFYFSIIAINLIVSILLISGVEIISPGMVLEKIVRLFVPGKPVQ